MISLTSATRRAEEFDAAVDGRTAQEQWRAELAELVDVVGALRASTPPAPRPDFVASLRERLLEEAETALTRDASLTLPPRRTGRERKLAVAATALVLIGGTAGMAAAAQDALPGEALYPIKRGIESAQSDLSGGPEAKGQRLLDQADTRLDEVQGLLADDATSTQVSGTLDTFVSQATEGSDLLLGSFAEEQDAASVTDVRDFTAQAMESLAALSVLAPSDLQDEFAAVADSLQQIDEEAIAACSPCADERPTLPLPSAFSGTAEAERALAALAGARINNDHPTIGGIKQPDGRGGKADTGQADGPVTSAGGDTSDAGGTGDTGDTGGVLSDLGDALGGLAGSNNGGSGSGASSGGGDALGDVTGPVKDTVKDVTPDPVDDALDQLLP